MKLIVKPWNIWWWRHLFAPRSSYNGEVKWRTVVWCRLRNHPSGVWYYTSYGLKPNMHCRICGDDLG